jgi:hypothetical protein
VNMMVEKSVTSSTVWVPCRLRVRVNTHRHFWSRNDSRVGWSRLKIPISSGWLRLYGRNWLFEQRWCCIMVLRVGLRAMPGVLVRLDYVKKSLVGDDAFCSTILNIFCMLIWLRALVCSILHSWVSGIFVHGCSSK